MIDVEHLIKERIDILQRMDRELHLEYAISEGGWGEIEISKGTWNMGVELIESMKSWISPGSTIKYGQIIRKGRYMCVLVPQDVLFSVTKTINDAGLDFLALGYDWSGKLVPPFTIVSDP